MKNFFKNPKYAFFIILILLFAVFVNTNTASAHWVSGSFSISYTVSNSNSQTTYKLTTNTAGTGSGTVSGGGTYNKGYVIPITANSSPDSKFVSWSGASCNVANTSSSSTTITMDTDKTCTANFTYTPPVTYKLTTYMSGTGSGTVSGGGTYNKGYVIPITANSSPDSKFVSWSGASCNVANTSSSSTTITMDTDKTCTANFTLVLVDGICAVNHYQCTSGAPIINNNSSGLDVWTWTCQGSSGGISHACTQNKPSFLEQ